VEQQVFGAAPRSQTANSDPVTKTVRLQNNLAYRPVLSGNTGLRKGFGETRDTALPVKKIPACGLYASGRRKINFGVVT